MQKFDLNRYNLEKLKLGEEPLKLKRTTYDKPKIKDGYLVDKEGNRIGTKGDMYTKKIMDDILQRGCLDHNPRPHYEDFYDGAKYDEETKTIKLADGTVKETYPTQHILVKPNGVEVWTPAHTLSVNTDVECTYDLSKGESPMITLRPIATKASCAEILWKETVTDADFKILGKKTIK